MPPDRLTIPFPSLHPVQCLAKRIYHWLVEKNPGLLVHHRVECPTGPKRHHRRPERHRLERGDAEVFDPGKDQTTRATEPLDDLLPRYVTEERDVGGRLGAEAVVERTGADDG